MIKHQKISFVSSVILALAFMVSAFFPATALAQSTPPEDNATTCAVEKIGWMICPVFEGAAKAADKAYTFLAEWFLEIPPELFNNESKTQDAWEQARNLANVAFVIAFIILIYSQITGGVMSNYGIKRMLPRLIIAAVAVNVSYYICQAMVDISNILGFNLKTALDTMAEDLPKVFYQDPAQVGSTNTQTSSGGLSAMMVGILAAAGLVWAFMAIAGGALGVVLGTIIFILIILMLRKALIILLIVVSPLAFVAYLLPNTETYFKQWLSMFWKLLMVFPIVALLLGGGQLASGIVLNSGVTAGNRPANATASTLCIDGRNTETGEPCGEGTFETGKGQAPWGLGLAAAVIAIGPLIFVYSVLKGALAVAGAFGGRVSAQLEKGSLGLGSGAQAAAKLGAKGAGKAAMANSTIAAMKHNWDSREHNKKLERARKIVDANENATGARATLLNLSSGGIKSGKREERFHANQANAVKMKKQLQAEEAEAIGMLGEAEAVRQGGSQEAFYGSRLEEAFRNGEEIYMKAYIDRLVALGKSGEDELERVLTGLSAANMGQENYNNLMGSRAFRSTMNHVLQNHGAIANTSNGIVTYAYYNAQQGGSKSMQAINNDDGDWTGLTTAQRANQRNADNIPALQRALETADHTIMDAAGNLQRVSGAEYARHHNLIGRVDNGVGNMAEELASGARARRPAP